MSQKMFPRKPSIAATPDSSPHDAEWFRIVEAAEFLDVSQNTIRRYIAAGRLRAYRVGPRLLRVDGADVRHLLRQVPTVSARPSR